mmetsp:Transcript_18350/g.30577  ORF Transcript_18350/g.30577 Transcript_18350/m.30577 type:complete len:94 (-) Transcript_18350:83-364(-)
MTTTSIQTSNQKRYLQCVQSSVSVHMEVNGRHKKRVAQTNEEEDKRIGAQDYIDWSTYEELLYTPREERDKRHDTSRIRTCEGKSQLTSNQSP